MCLRDWRLSTHERAHNNSEAETAPGRDFGSAGVPFALSGNGELHNLGSVRPERSRRAFWR
jgi:hypothetical protein